MEKKARFFSAPWLAGAVILAFAAMLGVGLFIPLQTDEVGWYFLLHRALIDGGRRLSLYPLCFIGNEGGLSRPLPWVWWLPAAINHLLYSGLDHLLAIRFLAFCNLFAWLGLWVAIACRLFALPARRAWLPLALILAALSLDAVPLVLLTNRPEQTLLITVGIFICAALYQPEIKQRRLAIPAALLLIVTTFCVYYAHPKALAFLPLQLALGGWFVQRSFKNKIFTTAFAGFIIVIALSSHLAWTARMDCTTSPATLQFIRMNYFPLSLLLQDPLYFTAKALGHVLLAMLTDFNIQYHLTTLQGWLQYTTRDSLPRLLPEITGNTAHAFYFVLLVLLVRACLPRRLRTMLHDVRKRGDDTRRIAILTLLTLVFAFALLFVFLGTHRPYYNVGLAVPLLILGVMLTLKITPSPQHAKFIPALFAFALFHLVVGTWRFSGYVENSLSYDRLIPEQVAIFSPWNYTERAKAAREAASACKITEGPPSQHILMDERAYPVFKMSREPIVYDTVIKMWELEGKGPMPAAKLLEVARGYQSSGIIAECTRMVPSHRAIAIEKDGYCCIPKSIIDRAVIDR